MGEAGRLWDTFAPCALCITSPRGRTPCPRSGGGPRHVKSGREECYCALTGRASFSPKADWFPESHMPAFLSPEEPAILGGKRGVYWLSEAGELAVAEKQSHTAQRPRQIPGCGWAGGRPVGRTAAAWWASADRDREMWALRPLRAAQNSEPRFLTTWGNSRFACLSGETRVGIGGSPVWTLFGDPNGEPQVSYGHHTRLELTVWPERRCSFAHLLGTEELNAGCLNVALSQLKTTDSEWGSD